MIPALPRTARLVSGVLAVCLTVALCLVLSAPPAQATHQNCGAKYPAGTLSNGHPDLGSSARSGWSGQTALNEVDAAVFALTSAKDLVLDGASVADVSAKILDSVASTLRKTLPDPLENIAAPIEAAAKVVHIVATTLTLSALAILIGETAAMGVQRAVAGAVGGENACNAVLGGDMLDQVWVATVQRNLASDGPPLAMLLIPTDSSEPGGDSGEWPLQPQHEEEDFGWCPEITLPEKIPTPAAETDLDQENGPSTDGDCTPLVLDGFLTVPRDGAPRVTVQAIVRDTIDHAKAHGLPVRQAEVHYADAVAAIGDQRFKKAFSHFRLAYRAAAGLDG